MLDGDAFLLQPNGNSKTNPATKISVILPTRLFFCFCMALKNLSYEGTKFFKHYEVFSLVNRIVSTAFIDL